MNRAIQWKLIVGFMLVFLAGGMTGAFVGTSRARHFFFEPRHHEMMSERMRDRFRRQLDLTPEQVAQITPILDKASAQLAEIRRNTRRQVHQTFMDTHQQMAAKLSDEQRVKLQRIESRHRHRRRFREPHSPHRP